HGGAAGQVAGAGDLLLSRGLEELAPFEEQAHVGSGLDKDVSSPKPQELVLQVGPIVGRHAARHHVSSAHRRPTTVAGPSSAPPSVAWICRMGRAAGDFSHTGKGGDLRDEGCVSKVSRDKDFWRRWPQPEPCGGRQLPTWAQVDERMGPAPS